MLYIICFIGFYCLYLLIFCKKHIRDLKIYNFNLNTILSITYVLLFIVLLLIFRYIRWGYTLDVITFYYNVQVFCNKKPFIFLFDIIILVIILFLGLQRIKNFLNTELLKRHLYYYYDSHLKSFETFTKKNPGKWPTRNDYSFYVRLCNNLELNYNYFSYVDKIVLYGILINYCTLLNTDSFPPRLKKYFTFILIHLFKIIFIILIIIDCVYYNYNIHLIFYYLPFYFVSHLWQKFSIFLKQTSHLFNKILYERYYLEDSVKYINTEDAEDAFIFKYIERHCICLTHDVKGEDSDDIWAKKEIIFAFPQIFIFNRRYERMNNTNIFKNCSTGEEILEETLKETPIN